ncbi:(S)-benzoin forming benzil reductase [Thalassorhabdus alkalitolerans]|uniref:(S)-benzoin forming benzil reductase n=2 Tax=Thalassorhabdus alkalitolerans TaxID=2282697 RepID=A0ABW0YKE7_9BACI
MKHIIITGASKGIGQAVASRFLKPGHHLFLISRTKSTAIVEEAKGTGAAVDFFSADLSDTTQTEQVMEAVFQVISPEESNEIILINNAGMIDPVSPAEDTKPADIAKNIQVNLTAPMILTSQFIKHSKEFEANKKVVNISSGAGKQPIYGWTAYCSAKAGLDLYTQTAALEQEEQGNNPVQIYSFAPGIVDTSMQEAIRSRTKEEFKEVEQFRAYKEKGQLLPPEKAAEALENLLNDPSLKNGSLLDITQFL